MCISSPNLYSVISESSSYTCNLATIGGPWYFDRAVVFQRLINQSFYQEILLLQKFNDIGGKVLKPKKNSASNLKKIK